MQEKLKQLELLTSQILARQKELQGENGALKARVRTLEDSLEKLKNTEAELRELKEWKKNTQTVLKRLAARIKKLQRPKNTRKTSFSSAQAVDLKNGTLHTGRSVFIWLKKDLCGGHHCGFYVCPHRGRHSVFIYTNQCGFSLGA